MSDRLLLTYAFATFAVGIACFGALLVVSRQRAEGPVRAFLFCYAALTALVFTRMILALFAVLPEPPADGVRVVFEYLESLPGRYALMFALVVFIHRVFGIDDRRREVAALVVTLIAFAGQHVTEYMLTDAWDDAGDVAEDVLFAAAMAYGLWIAVAHRNDAGVYRPLARRFLFVLVIGIPGIAWDLFLRADSAWRFYPLWYCVLSVVLTATLVRQRLPGDAPVPDDWGLSAREQEVAALLGRGLTNPDIARRLTISENTVKTHVRAIFDKSGVRNRAALISTLAHGSTSAVTPDHPIG